jgi:glycosyltransferase involved in cell wall biosynthesis
MNELVSIILPVYNAEKFLKTAIDSVLSQTYQYFELLIINDGSTDNTSNIIQTFNDPRIVFINQLSNKGITYRLNEGIKTATGKYIARIDADDIWHPQKLEKQINILNKNKNLAFIATDFYRIDYQNNILSIDKNSQYNNNLRHNILKKNLFCHSSIILKKEICLNVNLYDETIKHAEDYHCWIKILSKYDGIILPEILTYYRISSNQISFKKRKTQVYYTLKTKFIGFKLINFKLIYLPYLLYDLYRLSVPDWLISIKRKIFQAN